LVRPHEFKMAANWESGIKKQEIKWTRKFYKEDNEAIPAIVFELSAPVGFTEITDNAEIKELYLIQYQSRIDDGKNWVLDFTVGFITLMC